VVNTRASYSGGPGFWSWPRNQQLWLRFFVVFLSSSRRMLGQYLKIRTQPLPSKSSQWIIHLSPYHSTLYSLSYWKSVVTQSTNTLSVVLHTIMHVWEKCMVPITKAWLALIGLGLTQGSQCCGICNCHPPPCLMCSNIYVPLLLTTYCTLISCLHLFVLSLFIYLFIYLWHAYNMTFCDIQHVFFPLCIT
jgi:hypothetical protein